MVTNLPLGSREWTMRKGLWLLPDPHVESPLGDLLAFFPKLMLSETLGSRWQGQRMAEVRITEQSLFREKPSDQEHVFELYIKEKYNLIAFVYLYLGSYELQYTVIHSALQWRHTPHHSICHFRYRLLAAAAHQCLGGNSDSSSDQGQSPITWETWTESLAPCSD